eukprot:gnl/TRDRNA2_/TRDRNA2_189587_c0_seq1.p1 gnl/TRDRNA2_/TRDRNA2_189587_c0~~gnl/TRDRNA2_/TRDRNA2_189587_c0_seq1.p1  ORF type:complete len:297 (-),score=37.87 gnl/TRDRNA2_/TRDRNA2_189587_c0_seq1:320-1210(-)
MRSSSALFTVAFGVLLSGTLAHAEAEAQIQEGYTHFIRSDVSVDTDVCTEEDEVSLLRTHYRREKHSTDELEDMSPKELENHLRKSEQHMAGGKIWLGAHGDAGGDRMTFNGYAPIYAKYLNIVLNQTADPGIVEVGILLCTGVAMWADLLPQSKIYGFDINTTTCKDNIPALRKRGFRDEHFVVTSMDQQANNSNLFQSVFGNSRISIAVDDGYHVPEANVKTFLQLKPFLAERFVYFIEDVYPDIVENQAERWAHIQKSLREACPGCGIYVERPEMYNGHAKTSRVVVLTYKPV